MLPGSPPFNPLDCKSDDAQLVSNEIHFCHIFVSMSMTVMVQFFCFSAESQGVICATVFLFVMFCFTVVPFQEHLTKRGTMEFPFNKVLSSLFYQLFFKYRNYIQVHCCKSYIMWG